MGNYEVVRDLHYRRAGDAKDSEPLVIIKKGSVVKGVSKSSVSFGDQLMMDRVNKNAAKGNTRLGFFLTHGVVRYAAMVNDLKPTRRRVNVTTI